MVMLEQPSEASTEPANAAGRWAAQGESSLRNSLLRNSFQAKLTIILSDHAVAFAGGVFKFLAVHNLHCATGVLDELPSLQNAGGHAYGRSIRAEHSCEKVMSDGQRP